MPTAMITGPTSGIGRGFAETFARQGFDLVLVARDIARLQALAVDLGDRYGVACEVSAADLSRREDVDALATRLGSRERPVSVLVNNAGFGLYQSFRKSTIDDEQRMLDVMVTAVLRLTHAALPGMVERGWGAVINVSSVAAFLPGGTYSAAKSWVTVFTEGVAQGLAGTGVRATVVCPGFVHTEFHQRAGMDMASMPEWMWLDVQDVVDQTIRDLALKRPVGVPGRQYKVVSAFLRHGPRSLVRRVAGARQRQVRTGDPR